ncbi:phage tail sheath family protein [Paenibacillus sp. GYB004]|uniref:phage tail sheath family protein n=1 Tax=Paenibacillus sp. GYB004 TaxID=2994393 RepID=UPI002F963FEF
MAFKHGVYVTEQPTSILAPVEANSAIPFVVGTAPINLSKLAEVPVNKPILAYTYKEAVEALGYSDDWASYTLCEFIYSHFALYGLSPVILVNVLDPADTDHKETVVPASVPVTDGVVTIGVEGIVLSSVVVKSSDGTTTYTAADYSAAFDDKGHVVITRKAAGTIPANVTALQVGYDKLKPSGVVAADVIGGVDGTSGALTGLELINEAFPRFGLVPGLVLAPGYSQDPTVAAVMTAKAGNINGNFKAMALTDIPTDTVTLYGDVPAWKSDNSYTSTQQIPTWPMIKLGDQLFHGSTQIAGVIGTTDAGRGGVPYASPSNKALKANGAVLADGTEVFLGIDQANYLNSQGIVTPLNFGNGWRLWGNNTGAFPGTTDPKDSFIPVRRMFNWISNSIILTYMQKVDEPMNKRLVEAVTDSINIWLNGLTASGALLGGRVEFNASENPVTDLMAGKMRFHLYITPPSPAQEIIFLLEYDASYLAALTA